MSFKNYELLVFVVYSDARELFTYRKDIFSKKTRNNLQIQK